MQRKTTQIDERVIEIAQFLRENPAARRVQVHEVFADKLQLSTRRIDSLFKIARDYNRDNAVAAERERVALQMEEAREREREGILERNEALRILSTIATGQARRVTVDIPQGEGKQTEKRTEILIPSDKERVHAVAELAKMEGWVMPKKSETKIEIAEKDDYEDVQIPQELEQALARAILGLPEPVAMPTEPHNATESESAPEPPPESVN